MKPLAKAKLDNHKAEKYDFSKQFAETVKFRFLNSQNYSGDDFLKLCDEVIRLVDALKESEIRRNQVMGKLGGLMQKYKQEHESKICKHCSKFIGAHNKEGYCPKQRQIRFEPIGDIRRMR